MEKVYVLATSCGTGNYTPRVFASKEAALAVLKANFEEDVANHADCMTRHEMYGDCFVIEYVDDTYIESTVFECEVRK